MSIIVYCATIKNGERPVYELDTVHYPHRWGYSVLLLVQPFMRVSGTDKQTWSLFVDRSKSVLAILMSACSILLFMFIFRYIWYRFVCYIAITAVEFRGENHTNMDEVVNNNRCQYSKSSVLFSNFLREMGTSIAIMKPIPTVLHSSIRFKGCKTYSYVGEQVIIEL